MTQPEESKELAKLIVGKFIERRDVKAVQTKTGAYMPVRTNMKDTASPTIPWSIPDVVNHMEGKSTYGHYLVSQKGTCRVIVFDVDLRSKANTERDEEPIMFDGAEIDPRDVWAGPDSAAKRDLALQLRSVTEMLGRRAESLLELQAMVSYSGNKGMHAYVCLEPGTSAADAREGSNTILNSFEGDIVPDRGKNFFRHAFGFKAISIEVFPKQDDINPDGFGNLVRLPLGINQKSGKPGFFLDMNTPQTQFRIDDPMLALTQGSFRG